MLKLKGLSISLNRKNVFAFALTAVFLCLISYFFTGRAAFFNNDARFFNDIEFYVFASLIILLEIGIFVFAKKCFQIRFNKWLIFFCLFFFLSAFTAIIGYKGINIDNELIGGINGAYKFRCIILSMILFSSLYVIVSIIPIFVSETKTIRIIFYLASLIAIAAIVYSLIFESHIYLDVFSNKITTESIGQVVPQSFTAHRNIYGLILFMGMVGEGYLEIENPRWWRMLLIAFYLFQQFFTFSKTCMILGFFWMIFILIHSLIVCFLKKKHTHALFLIINSLLLMILVIICLFVNFKNTFLESVTIYADFLKTSLFDMFHNSMASREVSWTLPADAVNNNGPFSIIFGFGYGNEYRSLGLFAYNDATNFPIIDNAWGLMLAQNGIFGMIYGISMWGFASYLIVRSFIRKDRHSFFYMALFLCFLGRTFTENDTLSYFDWSGTVYFSFLCLPMLIKEAEDKSHKSLIFLEPENKKAQVGLN